MQTLTIVTEELDESDENHLRSLLLEDPSVDRVEDNGTRYDESRLEPVTFTLIAIGLIVGTGVVTRVADWWQARSDCLLVIDARTEDLRIEQRCDLVGYKGRTVIIADGATQVTVQREHGAITIDEVINAIKVGMPTLEQLASSQSPNTINIEPLQASIERES
jgi:hypothetical protein